MTSDTPITMSMAKATRYTGLSRYQLQRAIDARALPLVYIPGCQHPVVRRDDLDRLLVGARSASDVNELAGIRPIPQS
jgi:hypothetical protein